MRKRGIATEVCGITLAVLMIASMLGTLTNTANAVGEFNLGDTVEVYNTGSSGLLVRDAPCGNRIGGKFDGARGVILDGPVFCDGYNRWYIRWSDGLTGWSAEDWLRAVAPAGTPDLTVTSVSCSPPSATIGQSISVRFTVKNQGGSSSGSFSNRVSLATSAWGTTHSLGNFSLSSLGAGGSQTKTVSVTIPSVSPGNYYVTVFTDGLQQISESNEDNNIGSTYPTRISVSKPTPRYTLTTHANGQGSISPSGGTYDEGTRLTLTARPASSYTFVRWSGDASGSSTLVTITMNSNKSITAYFVRCWEKATNLSEYYSAWGKSLPPLSERGKIYEALGLGSASSYTGTAYQNTKLLNTLKQRQICPSTGREAGYEEKRTLSTSVSPSLSGSVSPSSGSYGEGTRLTLSANPASGYTFHRWGGDASGTSSPITITMNSDKGVTACFEEIPPQPDHYTLTTHVNGQGSISPDGGSYEEDSRLTLRANPASGYTFVRWGGDASGSSTSVTITMNSNKSVSACFEEIPPQLEHSLPLVNRLSVSPESVRVGNSFTISYSVSDDNGLVWVELWRADDDNGQPAEFREIKRTSVSGRNYSSSFSDTPSAAGPYWYGLHVVDTAGNWNCEKNSQTGFSPGVYGPIRVEVAPPQARLYTLTTHVSGSGSINPSGGTYDEDSRLTLRANPASGYTFVRWGGDASGSSTSVAITMDSNKSVTAYFQEIPQGEVVHIGCFDIPQSILSLSVSEGRITYITFDKTEYSPGETVEINVTVENTGVARKEYFVDLYIIGPGGEMCATTEQFAIEKENSVQWLKPGESSEFGPFKYGLAKGSLLSLREDATPGTYHVLAKLSTGVFDNTALDYRGIELAPPEETFRVLGEGEVSYKEGGDLERLKDEIRAFQEPNEKERVAFPVCLTIPDPDNPSNKANLVLIVNTGQPMVREYKKVTITTRLTEPLRSGWTMSPISLDVRLPSSLSGCAETLLARKVAELRTNFSEKMMEELVKWVALEAVELVSGVSLPPGVTQIYDLGRCTAEGYKTRFNEGIGPGHELQVYLPVGLEISIGAQAEISVPGMNALSTPAVATILKVQQAVIVSRDPHRIEIDIPVPDYAASAGTDAVEQQEIPQLEKTSAVVNTTHLSEVLDAFFKKQPSEITGGEVPSKQDVFEQLDRYFKKK